jgi:hypothetical protein
MSAYAKNGHRAQIQDGAEREGSTGHPGPVASLSPRPAFVLMAELPVDHGIARARISASRGSQCFCEVAPDCSRRLAGKRALAGRTPECGPRFQLRAWCRNQKCAGRNVALSHRRQNRPGDYFLGGQGFTGVTGVTGVTKPRCCPGSACTGGFVSAKAMGQES